MELFKRINENEAEVYSIYLNLERFKEFVTKEMLKIPVEERVYSAYTNFKPVLNTLSGQISWESLLINEPNVMAAANVARFCNPYWHYLTLDEDKRKETSEQSTLMKQLANGDFLDRKVIKIAPAGERKRKIYNLPSSLAYLLLTKEDYEEKNKVSVMKDIISIPKSLYLQQILQQALISRDYERILEEDFSTQFGNYDMSTEPIKTCSLEECGISMPVVKQSELVLSKTLSIVNK